jgi:RNA polymerase sigma factor (sigma-70 family)
MSVNHLTQQEIDDLANEYIRLKNKAEKSKSFKSQNDFINYQNYCMKKLEPLVTMRTNKYKKYSNYPDLNQDGFEALVQALKTFDASKGNFVGWAHQYIATRISRSANAHTTIRYPLKKAKMLQPYKTSSMPIMVDLRDPQQNIEIYEKRIKVMEAIDNLPEVHKKAIMMKHEFSRNENSSISKISEQLKISRPMCMKILQEAESILRNNLKTIRE